MENLQSFFIPFTLPTLNEIIAAAKSGHGKGNSYARMKQSVTMDIYWCIKEAGLKPMTKATILFYWKEKNKRKNPDNIAAGKKFVLDALVNAGILSNDGWGQVIGVADKWAVDTKNPGVYVELYET